MILKWVGNEYRRLKDVGWRGNLPEGGQRVQDGLGTSCLTDSRNCGADWEPHALSATGKLGICPNNTICHPQSTQGPRLGAHRLREAALPNRALEYSWWGCFLPIPLWFAKEIITSNYRVYTDCVPRLLKIMIRQDNAALQQSLSKPIRTTSLFSEYKSMYSEEHPPNL